MTRFIVIGNPENRRVTMFSGALEEAGLPPPELVPWLSLAAAEDASSALEHLSHGPALVRIDSCGENSDVEAALLARGLDDAKQSGASTIDPVEARAAVKERGRIVCPRQAHFGFLRVLGELERAFAQRPEWSILNTPRAIADLFDKRTTSALYASRGVPVPRPLLNIDSADALRARMDDEDLRAVYVKISSSSSASGLAVFQRTKSGESLMTTVELDGDRYYNSLVVRRVQRPRDVDTILGFLLREGSQIEVSVPKARIDGYYFDLRILVITGRPVFTVVRQSRHPITNLHLGGRRGELVRLRELVPKERLEEAHDSARRASEAHDTLHVGVDVLLEARTHQPYVVEANAFGDLLPNLTHEGLSVYAHEIRAALARTHPRIPGA